MAGTIVTFYSYKGGVGRSFALVNTATVLSAWGFKVLCVDWDLEAPGLDAYFRPVLTRAPAGGLADVFTGFAAGAPEDPDQYVVPIGHETIKGRLDLLPAGAGDGYVKQVQRLDWAAMYQDQNLGEQLEKWRDRWIQDYDFVLIDSRTGITDIGGICTAQLPDILVTMFTANEQSLRGILDVARRADDARDRLPYDRPRLMVLPVPSRFEGREEYQQAAHWRERFVAELKPLLDRWVSRTAPLDRLLGHVTVPYISFWSFGEQIAAVKEPNPTPDDIMYSLQSIAALIAHRLDRTDSLTDARDAYVAAAARAGQRSWDVQDTRIPVFLSYRTEDRAVAREIADEVARRGLRVLDPATAFDAGKSWDVQLREQLSVVPLMICLLGERTSAQQGQEIDLFARQAVDDDGERVLVAVTPRPMLLSALTQVREVSVDMAGTLGATARRVADAVEFEAAAVTNRRLLARAADGDRPAHLEVLSSSLRLGRLAERQSELTTARQAYRSVLAIAADLPASQSGVREIRHVAEAHDRLGHLASMQGDIREAAGSHRMAAQLYESVADADRTDQLVRRDLGAAWLNLSRAEKRLGDGRAAESAGRRALAVLEELVRRDPADTSLVRSLRDVHTEVGTLCESRGDLDAAMVSYRAALSLDARLVSAAPADVPSLENLARSHVRIADLARDLGRFDLADDSYRNAIEIYGGLNSADPGNAAHLRSLAGLYRQAGDSSASVPDLVAARACYEEAQGLYEALVPANPADAETRRELGLIHLRLGDIALDTEDSAGARSSYEGALSCFEFLDADPSVGPQNRRDVGVALNKLGDVAMMRGDLDAAGAAYRRGLEINQALAAMDRADVNAQRDLSTSHAKLAGLARARGDSDAARVSYRAALTIAQRTYGMDAVALDLRDRLRSIDSA